MDKVDYELYLHCLDVYPSEWLTPATVQNGKRPKARRPPLTLSVYPSQRSPG